MFAFRDGIISSVCLDGGVCFNKTGAYAIILKGEEETIKTPSSPGFVYKPDRLDRGRYRLTSGDFYSRSPIRVLRSHTLHSPWAPNAGLRYDGLYRVTGWSCVSSKSPDAGGHSDKKLRVEYHIQFEREDEVPFHECLRHPCAEELDDYEAYRQVCKSRREPAVREESTHTPSHLVPTSKARAKLGFAAVVKHAVEESHGVLFDCDTISDEPPLGEALDGVETTRAATTGLTSHLAVFTLPVALPGHLRPPTAARPSPNRRNFDGSADDSGPSTPHKATPPAGVKESDSSRSARTWRDMFKSMKLL